jgi:MFS transporter, DHA1 family, inner membrane transport protein
MQMMRSPGNVVTTRWGVVATALLAGIIAAGHVGKLPPALPSIRAELGLNIVTASWLASLFSATGLLTGLFLGAVADRLDHWRFAVGGLALMAVSGFCGALSATPAQLIVSRLFEGVGFLAVVIAAPSIIARATNGRARRTVLGLWPGYMPAGISAMILVAPFALRVGGWRALWLTVAVLAALGTAVMWVFGQEIERQALSSVPIWQNIRTGAARLSPWLVGGCFALYGAQLYAIVTWMPTFMIDERGVGASTAAALTALIVVANGACNILGSWLLHRGAAPWAMMAISGALMAVAAFGTFTAGIPDLARYLCSITVCGAGGVVASATFAAAPSFAASPAQLGVVNGILVQASGLAQFVGPTALAASVTTFGRWESALWMMIGANVLLIAFALLLRRQPVMLPHR